MNGYTKVKTRWQKWEKQTQSGTKLLYLFGQSLFALGDDKYFGLFRLQAKHEGETCFVRDVVGNDCDFLGNTQGWAYLVVVNDWFTKKIVGAFVADRSRASDWLEAVNLAVCRQFPVGIREA